MSKEILLFSSGMDSYIAWLYLNKPDCLYVDLGHRYARKEKDALHWFVDQGMKLGVDNRLFLGDIEKEDANIPMRNMFLAMIGSLYGDVIYIIAQKGEMDIPDRSEGFYKSASEMLTLLWEKPKKVITPLADMTKAQMAKWYMDNTELSMRDLMEKTVGCYSSKEGHCGECSACFRKFCAFAAIGSNCEYIFEKDIRKWKGIKAYVKKLKKGKYDAQREAETIQVLKECNLW